MPTEHEIGKEAARRLDQKLSGLNAIEDRIKAIAHDITGRIAFSTSLGIEDQAVLHAVAETKADIDIFTLDTGRHFRETLDTIQQSELRYGRRIRIVFPDAKETENLVNRDGLFGFRLSIEARKSCCEIRKVRPLNRALDGASAWITGLRRSQSSGRADVPFAAWDSAHALIKLNPIADRSLEQLESYIETNKIPINPLHAKGYPSIGCEPCTRAIKPGEDIRAGRWWWENEDGKECGLHNRPQSEASNTAAKKPADGVTA